jgi:Tol biopolymer transport system component
VQVASLVVAGAVVFTLAIAGDSLARESTVDNVVDDQAGSFSPDGETIVFARHFSKLRRGIDTHPVPERAVVFLMRADGSRERALLHRGVRFEHDATFSPDGRFVLFVREARIFVMRQDGSGAREVRPDALEQACPRFSPDGSMISFWRGSAKRGAYFVMRADGTGLRRLAGSRGERTPWGCPSWFPDGEDLVFVNDYNLFIASVDGSQVERLTDDRDGQLYRPSVSPDGRWIACDGFVEGRDAGNGIVVMRANGTAIHRITTYTDEFRPDGGATWAPNGRKILFSGYRGRFKGAGVYVVRRDGSGLRRLTNSSG